MPGRVASVVLVATLLGVATVLTALTGCASDATPTPSPTPTTPRATFRGAASGYVVLGACSSAADSIIVRFDGHPAKYAGSITPTSMGFVGPGAAPWVLDASTKPAASADATRYVLDGVRLHDTAHPSRTITLTGTVVCP